MRPVCPVSGKAVIAAPEAHTPEQNSPQEGDYKYPVLKPSFAEICLPLSQFPYPKGLKYALNPALREFIKPCPENISAPQPSSTMSLIKSNLIPQSLGLNKLLMFLLGFCLPVGGPCGQEKSEQCQPFLICLPTEPHVTKEKCEEEEIKPIGLITRIKEADFIGGRFIAGCTCGRKNGLQGDCPRISCRNNPGCSMNPPRCWPQFKEPEKPILPPDQNMVCVPIQLMYYDPSNSS